MDYERLWVIRVGFGRSSKVWVIMSYGLPEVRRLDSQRLLHSTTMPVNCKNVLENGTCTVPNCTSEHNITVCEPCGRVFNDSHSFRQHLSGKRHRVDSTNSGVLSCPICDVNVFQGPAGWQRHLNTKSHRAKATAQGIVDVQPELGKTKGLVRYCDFCECIVNLRDWKKHINNRRHNSKVNFVRYRAAVEDSEKDKNGVTITGSVDFGFVAPRDAAKGEKVSATITSTQPFSHSVLLSISLASSQGASKRSAFSVILEGSERKIATTKPLVFEVVLTESHIGRYEDRAEFLFEDTQLKQRFMITRSVKAIVGNSAEHQALAPKAPYVPRKRTNRKPIRDVIEGVRPPAMNAIPYVGKLPMATIPPDFSDVLSSSKVSEKLAPVIKGRFLPATLNNDTYARHFKQLLWAEEYQAELDLERYDIENATLTRHNKFFYLTVDGLAEKRPSVLIGDLILVQGNKDTDRWFEGHVHVVHRDEVGLCFHSSFARTYSPSATYHVRFKLNRIPVRRQHMALATAFNQDRVLFPQPNQLASTIKTPRTFPIKVFNPLIASNPPQLQAVISILSSPPGSPPFVVFGPPGTGKTVTIVEAIKQILANDRNAKILACAPSNSAVDLIASRLIRKKSCPGLTTDELLRIYAPSRKKAQVPDDLSDFTYSTPDGHLSIPPMAQLKRIKVILATCVSAAIVQGVGLPRGHFSHIFIDEAGQATEPETFVSIKLMADLKTNIALSGDPKQLGPIIRSGVARQLGLEVSYLERLMDRDAYNLTDGYGKSVVKLVKNFRSHPAILKYPNERFYANDLEACGEPATINFYIKSQYLPSKKFPIVFHSVSGKDDREASSPSFFNIDEASQVKSYVQKLKEDRRFRTTDDDIGIIAPYHAQCLKLKAVMRAVADGIKIGSVEEFQGQERKVIIISTVRSSKEFVNYDLRHTLGFVANPRRFNVAITRAKALLIVIGDPNVLSLDPLWRCFLNYVYLNGGWTGPDITWDPNARVDAGGFDQAMRNATDMDMNAFTKRMESLTLTEVEDEVDANVDRPWRELE